ncbi:MAG: uracil-DNA glycosylase family protein [Limisphaerales bacterium]|jgi:DNA polymerase
MNGSYHQLLDAVIRDLENRKARGVKHVPVTPQTLAALRQAPAATPTAAPLAARLRYEEPPAAAPAAPARPVAPAQPPRKPVFRRPAAPAPPPRVELPAISTLPPMDPTAKAAAFAALREQTLVCAKCPNLVATRTQVVFGVGNPDAELMFIGEAPGADEDAQGEPFVGAAGQLLTKIIAATGLTRQQVYIANILKCRPDMPPGASGNRKPTPEEMATCIPWLHQQIELIRPRVLVALGATAAEGLLGRPVFITKLRGQWQTWRGLPLMPTYHPAYLLRNQALTEKRKVWEDMLAVMEKLGLPISNKQRGYFLKAG